MKKLIVLFLIAAPILIFGYTTVSRLDRLNSEYHTSLNELTQKNKVLTEKHTKLEAMLSASDEKNNVCLTLRTQYTNQEAMDQSQIDNLNKENKKLANVQKFNEVKISQLTKLLNQNKSHSDEVIVKLTSQLKSKVSQNTTKICPQQEIKIVRIPATTRPKVKLKKFLYPGDNGHSVDRFN